METTLTQSLKDSFNAIFTKHCNVLEETKKAAYEYIVAVLKDHNGKVELCADDNLFVMHDENYRGERSHVNEIFLKDDDRCRVYLRLDTTDTECPIFWFEPEEIVRIATYLEFDVFTNE
jgi:hypothetical protein